MAGSLAQGGPPCSAGGGAVTGGPGPQAGSAGGRRAWRGGRLAEQANGPDEGSERGGATRPTNYEESVMFLL